MYKNTYSLHRYPLALGYLSGTIRGKTDWNVIAYNADFHPKNAIKKITYFTGEGFHQYLYNLKNFSGQVWQEVRATISAHAPAIVGISTKSQNFASSLAVAKIAKEINEKTLVVMGGPHPSMAGTELLNFPEIDICVRGEGEETIVELLDAIDAQKKLGDIQGISFRKQGTIVKNPPREFIKDLDTLCFPHEGASSVLKDYHSYPVSAFQNIFATRGCPYHCTFCGSRKIWSRRVRFRSPLNIVNEIKSLQKIGVKEIYFADDTFGVSGKNISDICRALILSCPGIQWSCEMNMRLVNQQNISKMKSAGCHLIQVGIESGNNEMLARIRKNIRIEQALEACRLIKESGVSLQGYFMVGFPDEDEDTLKDTVTAMKRSNCDEIIYSIFTPYPGTEIFNYCREKGLIRDDYDVSFYNHKSPANSFCMNIPAKRFRTLARKIEKMVERKNRRNRLKQVFSSHTFRRIRGMGTAEILRRGIRILLDK